MSARAVLGDAWRLYNDHRRHLVSVALVVYAVLGLLPLLAVLFPLLVLPFLAFFFLAGFFWLQAALVQAANDIRDGYADLTTRQTLARVWRRVNALSAASLVVIPAVALGLALLVLPGVVLLVAWSLVVPLIVLERAAPGRALRRSRWLVRGNLRPLLAVVVPVAGLFALAWGLAAVAALVPAAAVGDALPALPRLPDWLWAYGAGYLVFVVASSLATPFGAVALTLAYFALRDVRGPGPPVRAKLAVGDILGEAWRVYTLHPHRLVPAAAALFALLALPELALGFLGSRSATLAAVFLVTTVGFLVLHSGVAVALPDLRGPDGVSPRGVTRRVGRRFFRILAAWGVVTVVVVLGLTFFLVPGLVLLTYWSLITPVILFEGKGVFASFRRSAKLVGGNGLRVFAVVVPTIFVWNYSLAAAELAPLPPFLYVSHVMLNSLVMPYLALAWTLAYYRLRALPDAAAP